MRSKVTTAVCPVCGKRKTGRHEQLAKKTSCKNRAALARLRENKRKAVGKKYQRAAATRKRVASALVDALVKPLTQRQVSDIIRKTKRSGSRTPGRIDYYLDKSEYTIVRLNGVGNCWYARPVGPFNAWSICGMIVEDEESDSSIINILKRRRYEEVESWPPGPLQWIREGSKVWWSEPVTEDEWPEDLIAEEAGEYYDSGKARTQEE